MRKKNLNTSYRFLLSVLFVWAIFLPVALGQAYTQYKKIEKTFKVNSNTTVDITNKYGKIDIIPWNKDSTKIGIIVSYKSQQSGKVKKILDNISFDFTPMTYYITVATKLEIDYSNILPELIKLQPEININYTVYLPVYCNLKINNKYGDIFIDELNGNCDLNLFYGNFKAGKLNGNNQLTLEHGDGTVNYINSGIINLSYTTADLRIKKANQLNLVTKSAVITIDEINILKSNSKRSKYFISNINYLYGNSYFDKYQIENLNNEVNFDMQYGEMKVQTISSKFSFINLFLANTDIFLNFQKSTSYQLDITHEDTGINVPKDLANLQEKILEDDERINTYGSVGNVKTSSKVRINAEGGSLTIQHK